MDFMALIFQLSVKRVVLSWSYKHKEWKLFAMNVNVCVSSKGMRGIPSGFDVPCSAPRFHRGGMFRLKEHL